MLIEWATPAPRGTQYAVPYLEIRFLCPCARCVNEITGERILKRESLDSEIRPVGMNLVGQYAISIKWSDGHESGIYSFEKLETICRKHGVEVSRSI